MQRLAGRFDMETKATEDIAGLRQMIRANEEIIGKNRQIISEWERCAPKGGREALFGTRTPPGGTAPGGSMGNLQLTVTKEQLRAAKIAVDAGNNGAENNGLENP